VIGITVVARRGCPSAAPLRWKWVAVHDKHPHRNSQDRHGVWFQWLKMYWRRTAQCLDHVRLTEPHRFALHLSERDGTSSGFAF
jgi:hypothetical protein